MGGMFLAAHAYECIYNDFLFYIGNVNKKFLISFLAQINDLQFFIESGALFHNLVESL